MATIQKTAVWQRLRVAFLGLAAVSLAIFSANAIVEQNSIDPNLADANLQQDIDETGSADGTTIVPREPLVELGVTPVPKEDSQARATEVAEPGANPVSEDELFDQVKP